MSKLKKILIANRGEIAVRIARTCAELGIQSVAVYSDADAESMHRHAATESVHLPGNESKETYLVIKKILDAAKKTGADAVHPGYGFLAEQADFADAVTKAGLTFIGPSAAMMKTLGDKIEAKKLAIKLKVPTLESLTIKANQPLTKPEIKQIGLPMLIKAAAGGGGRGMRIVRDAEQLTDLLTAAQREALAFFGDGTVFVERLIEGARHIEIQILGDGKGEVVALGDRDCTAQRKHQKVIEEAPAVNIPDAVRKKMHQSAVKLGEAVSYAGVGTVEFLLTPENEFFFLEVNTRLQVEHPVTEAVTGFDLVALQIGVAEGKSLKTLLPDGVPEPLGHAIEIRLCGEDPRRDFAPGTGKILALNIPKDTRTDTGFRAGDTVSHYYDSLLTKVIVHRNDRDETINDLIKILETPLILGLVTNQSYLKKLLSEEQFKTMCHHTRWAEGIVLEQIDSTVAAIGWYLDQISILRAESVGFGSLGRRYDLKVGESALTITVSHRSSYQFDITVDKQNYAVTTKENTTAGQFNFTVNKKSASAHVRQLAGTSWVTVHGDAIPVTRAWPALKTSKKGQAAGPTTINSPLPGKVLEIKIDVNSAVTKGGVVLILESMKMEHPISAPTDGMIKEVLVKPGQVVDAGQVLMRFE